jgi:hypothetical protein
VGILLDYIGLLAAEAEGLKVWDLSLQVKVEVLVDHMLVVEMVYWIQVVLEDMLSPLNKTLVVEEEVWALV